MQSVPGCGKWWFVLLTILVMSTARGAEHQLSLVTAALPPLGPSAGDEGYLVRIAEESFSRIGYNVDVSILPAERALINANNGIDDGDMYRAPGFENAYPNLVQVPEPIGVMEFMAYSKDLVIPDMNWKSLNKYVVAYATGWKIYDRMVHARDVTKVRSINELFPLLEMNRAELVLMDRWQGSYLAEQQGVRAKLMEPALARVDMYMYLNKRYEDLIPKLTAALKAMKKDGSFQRIFNASLKHN